MPQVGPPLKLFHYNFDCFNQVLTISKGLLKPGFHYTTNATTTTQKQSDYKVEQSSFTLIALFCPEIGRVVVVIGSIETRLKYQTLNQ